MIVMTKRAAASVCIWLGLLAVTTSASAECAWVLWTVASTIDSKVALGKAVNKFYRSQWQLVGGYKTSEACDEAESKNSSEEWKEMFSGRRPKDSNGFMVNHLFAASPTP